MSNQGKTKQITTICPRCHGTGMARAFNRESKYDADTIKKAKSLRSKDMTFRAIANEMGISHPQTIINMLEKK